MSQNSTLSESAHFKENFHAKMYIDDYYPPIKDGDVCALLKIHDAIKDLETVDGFDLHIQKLTRSLSVSPEMVENIALLFFQRRVLLRMMQDDMHRDIDVLDIGGGPTIYQHIIHTPFVHALTHAEFISQNRDEVSAWTQGDETAHNWRSYFDLIHRIFAQDSEFLQLLEEKSKHINEAPSALSSEKIHSTTKTVTEREAHLKDMLKDRIVSCDVFADNLAIGADEMVRIFSPESRKLITSHFVVESATNQETKWKSGMQNILSLLDSGDVIAQSFISGSEWYKNGDQKMPALAVSQEMIALEYAAENVDILYCGTIDGSDVETTGYTGMIFVLGKKK